MNCFIFVIFIVVVLYIIFIRFYKQQNINLKNELIKKNEKLSQLVKDKDHELLKLQHILDKSPVSIIITDKNGDIQYANPWFTKLTGYSLKELNGQNPRVLKSDFHDNRYYKNLWYEITHGKVWNGTFKNVTKTGEEYWESAIIAPVNDEKGELEHFIAIKQEITQQVYLEDRVSQQDKDKRENFEKTLESFVQIVEKRDTYTAGHSKRVAEYAKLIAKEMKLSKKEIQEIYRASILHDIGKVATPDNVLLKPGSLTKLEYQLIKEHVNSSYEILHQIPMYKELAEIIIHHHERYDGNGYPKGLTGNEIPLLSHIMIVADAFDAMTTNRIYKGRKTISEAMKELQECSHTQFHPEVVKCALVALKDVTIDDTSGQLPETDIEKERFSYFYRDQVTSIYNADYLKFILNQNNINHQYACINILYMHNFSKYNTKHGWSEGDKLLSEFANHLSSYYKDAQIFRIHGDDFVLINTKHLDIDLKKLQNLEILTKHDITLTKKHIDMSKQNILDLKDLQHI